MAPKPRNTGSYRIPIAIQCSGLILVLVSFFRVPRYFVRKGNLEKVPMFDRLLANLKAEYIQQELPKSSPTTSMKCLLFHRRLFKTWPVALPVVCGIHLPTCANYLGYISQMISNDRINLSSTSAPHSSGAEDHPTFLDRLVRPRKCLLNSDLLLHH